MENNVITTDLFRKDIKALKSLYEVRSKSNLLTLLIQKHGKEEGGKTYTDASFALWKIIDLLEETDFGHN